MKRVLIYHRKLEKWLLFPAPHKIYETQNINEVLHILEKLDQHIKKDKYYVAGFITYAAAPAFDESMKVKPNVILPLICFGIYSKPYVIDLSLNIKENEDLNINWESEIDKNEFEKNFLSIKSAIENGEVYQINYTYKYNTKYNSNIEKDKIKKKFWNYFKSIIKAQKFHYGAWIEADDWIIASATPELFFKIDNNQIEMHPMKGTSKRSLTLKEDIITAYNLQNSFKARAENGMIVDMVRNDLSRFSANKVAVKSLFTLEQYPSLWQLTSNVITNTISNFSTVIKNIFPPASITGAPKISSVNLINKLEKSPREIYTGSIGFWTPDSYAQFNVAIRTLLFDLNKKNISYGVGSGIVWDSDVDEEWEEGIVKTKILYNINKNYKEFSIFETILWKIESGFTYLDDHISRLINSADYFQFKYDEDEIKEKFKLLDLNLKSLDKINHQYKVKLILEENGKVKLIYQKWDPKTAKIYKIILGKNCKIDSKDPFLYHKTTQRKVYENARNTYPEYDDVLLINEKNEVTESTIANIIIKQNNEFYTPPVSCGLLEGVYRKNMINENKLKEKILTIDEVMNADEVNLINSIRGIWNVSLVATK